MKALHVVSRGVDYVLSRIGLFVVLEVFFFWIGVPGVIAGPWVMIIMLIVLGGDLIRAVRWFNRKPE